MISRRRLAVFLFALAGLLSLVGFLLMPERFKQILRDVERGPA